ncbi:MAG: hypothetical protein JRG84_09685 [Deltaproteobacteria bacterium]|nr:hypothetical protein [Deltaproteobacteria bacterium]
MRSARQSRPSRGRRFAERLLAVLVALDAAFVVWIWLHGPFKLDVGRLPFGIEQANPLHVLPVLGLAWCALTWRNRRSWLGLAPEHTLHLRGVHPLAWLILPLSAALLGAQLLAPLVRGLVQRPSPEPVVVWIDDLDRRGHSAAFYLYPRLMLMEPAQRRWTLQQRMTVRGGPNPHFRIGHRPSEARSRAFAKERGAELVFAKRAGGQQASP